MHLFLSLKSLNSSFGSFAIDSLVLCKLLYTNMISNPKALFTTRMAAQSQAKWYMPINCFCLVNLVF